MSEILEFTQYPVTTGISLAYLFSRNQARHGIYILTFSDGSEYVGQTTDVLSRFRTHSRQFGLEIVGVQFAPVLRSSLDTLEALTIRSRQDEGTQLRNKNLIGLSTNRSQPEHWLPSTYPLVIRTHPYEENMLASGHRELAVPMAEPFRNYSRLNQHPKAQIVIDALAVFLQHSVPIPAHSEQQAWVATAVPRSDDGLRRLACLTIQNQHLLTFFDDAKGGTYATINLSQSPRIDPRYKASEIDFKSGSGIMQHARLDVDVVIQALNDDVHFCAAARSAASGLLGRGPSIIRYFHCRPLADAMYASISRSG